MKQTQKCQCIASARLKSQQQERFGSVRYNDDRILSEAYEKVLLCLQKTLPSAVPYSASASANDPLSSHLKKMRAHASAKLLLDSDLLN